MPAIIQELRRRFRRQRKHTDAVPGSKQAAAPSHTDYVPQAAFFLVLALVTTFMFPKSKTYQFTDLKVGDVYIGEEIIAPFTFPINKSPDEYERDVERAKNSVPAVFVRNDSIAEEQIRLLTGLLQTLKREELSGKHDSSQISTVTQTLGRYGISLSEDALRTLPRLLKTPSVVDKLTGALRRIYSSGLLDLDKQHLPTASKRISVVSNGSEIMDELRFYYDKAQAQDALLQHLREALGDEDLVKTAYLLTLPFLKPNLHYNEAETQRRIDEAVRNVPRAKGMVLERERIIDSHERVTPEHLEKLRSLAEALAERRAQEGGLASALPYISRFLFLCVILGVLVFYLYWQEARVFASWQKTLLIVIALFFTILMTFLVNRSNVSGLLIPVTVTSMLLTIFFNSRLGFVGTVVTALIVGAMRGNEFAIAAITIIAGVVAVSSVYRVRSRSWVLKTILKLVAAYVLTVTIFELLRYTPFSKLAVNVAYGAVNGFLSPIFTYGLAVVLEFAFDVTTDMTLLELSDLNQPLLRELAVRAPGTYHHSLMVGNLAEAAAEAIGANSLLARVGAYYHDIGKIEKPEYFIENQADGRNPHDKLTPSMSALILANHIRRGIEIAKEAGLPDEIVAFIREHQGTQLMRYFYERAKEANQGEIDEQKFRYPGPKPQSRETAIVMLADAVEAAVRSLKQPSATRIRQTVHSIIQQRFNEGELNQSPLTLRDLSRIEDAFVQVLMGVYHSRIEYPEEKETQPQSENEAKEPAAKQLAPAEGKNGPANGKNPQHDEAPRSKESGQKPDS